MGSDHRPIIAYVNRQVRSVKVFSYKHKLSKEQWRNFTSILQSRAKDLEAEVLEISDKELLQQYRVFFNQVDNVLSEFSPPARDSVSLKHRKKDGTHTGPPPAPWWTKECSEAVQTGKRVCKTYRKNPSVANYQAYRAQLSLTRKILRKAKRDGWREYCSSLDFLTPTVEVWRMLKRYKNRKLASANPSAGVNSEQIDIAMANICPPSCNSEPLNIPDNSASTPDTLSWMDSVFQFQEFEAALDSVKVKSSPGFDRIDYQIIKSLPSSLQKLLLRILNNLFLEGAFPETWSHSLVYLIPKPHGGGVSSHLLCT
ncbi:uncharacterized protein LOC112462272 [Temnothorax curvispinosus]|uniref:Uncharacterized protein LOC112462272 n=1 Tax=Temnothorax curvispinosus TaxID=300111 RepID=A0A6J1QMM6_9HYME|nr:uncharacterized protein LOC112462272 [Temnothorax curvispinosus]